MEKDLNRIWKIICDPDVYDYAYENCETFRIYINSLPEATMAKIRKNHSLNKMSDTARGVKKGLLHLGTFGMSYAAEKLLFKSKKQKVAELVDTEEFSNIFKALYSSATIFK